MSEYFCLARKTPKFIDEWKRWTFSSQFEREWGLYLLFDYLREVKEPIKHGKFGACFGDILFASKDLISRLLFYNPETDSCPTQEHLPETISLRLLSTEKLELLKKELPQDSFKNIRWLIDRTDREFIIYDLKNTDCQPFVITMFEYYHCDNILSNLLLLALNSVDRGESRVDSTSLRINDLVERDKKYKTTAAKDFASVAIYAIKALTEESVRYEIQQSVAPNHKQEGKNLDWERFIIKTADSCIKDRNLTSLKGLYDLMKDISKREGIQSDTAELIGSVLELIDELGVKRVKEETIKDLSEIFFNNRQEVLRFLNYIKGRAPEKITDYVNLLIREGKIDEDKCRKELFAVLKKYDLYDRGKSTWYDKITIPRR